jgi:hypothetical protein
MTDTQIYNTMIEKEKISVLIYQLLVGSLLGIGYFLVMAI